MVLTTQPIVRGCGKPSAVTTGKVHTVEEYIAKVASEEDREALLRLRKIIQEEVPDAQETIAYGIPTYKFHGHLVSFAAFKSHCSFFPGHTVADFRKELAGFKILKGTVQFQHNEAASGSGCKRDTANPSGGKCGGSQSVVGTKLRGRGRRGMSDTGGFRDAAAELLREAFEGVAPGKNSTWFVEKKEAILPTLHEIGAEGASRTFTLGGASIGAHVRHLIYIMTWGNACHGGGPPIGTWNDTWLRNEFTEDEWTSMQVELEERYRSYLTWFGANEDWSQGEGPIGPLAIVPHVAYHLGAIRQLFVLVISNR